MLIVKKAAAKKPEAYFPNIEWMRMIEGSKASKEHTCTWCGQAINKGEKYIHWLSIDAETPVVNKLHPECFAENSRDYRSLHDYEYEFFVNARPRT